MFHVQRLNFNRLYATRKFSFCYSQFSHPRYAGLSGISYGGTLRPHVKNTQFWAKFSSLPLQPHDWVGFMANILNFQWESCFFQSMSVGRTPLRRICSSGPPDIYLDVESYAVSVVLYEKINDHRALGSLHSVGRINLGCSVRGTSTIQPKPYAVLR